MRLIETNGAKLQTKPRLTIINRVAITYRSKRSKLQIRGTLSTNVTKFVIIRIIKLLYLSYWVFRSLDLENRNVGDRKQRVPSSEPSSENQTGGYYTNL